MDKLSLNEKRILQSFTDEREDLGTLHHKAKNFWANITWLKVLEVVRKFRRLRLIRNTKVQTDGQISRFYELTERGKAIREEIA